MRKLLSLLAVFLLPSDWADAASPPLVLIGNATSGHCLSSVGGNGAADSGAACGTGNVSPATNLSSIRYASGLWYTSHIGNSATAAGVVAVDGRMYAHKWNVSSASGSITFKAMGIRVVAAGSGSQFKTAIYDTTGTNGNPGNLVAGGTTPAATTSPNADAVVTLDSLVTFPNGSYWVVQLHHTTSTMPSCITWSTITSLNTLNGATTVNGSVNDETVGAQAVFADTTYSTAFPPAFGTATDITGKTGNWCLMAVQVN